MTFYHHGLLREQRFDPKRLIGEELANWAYDLEFSDIPDYVLDKVKYLALDAAGLAIPGITAEGPSWVLNFVKSLNYPGPCTVIGTTHKAGPQYAALAAGAAVTGYSLFDSHREAQPTHCGPSNYPAAYAISQIVKTDFPTFATALTISYEIEAKIGLCLNPGIGCIDTHQVNVPGVALQTAKMLGLNRGQFLDALGHACYQAAGLFEFDARGYNIRPNNYGWLATHGIHSALLAKAGHPAPITSLEGGYGFINQFSSKPDISVFDKLGNPWELPHNSIKKWQGSRYMHSAIDCVVDICTANDLKPNEIKQITLEHGNYIHSLGALPEDTKKNPTVTEQGRLNLFFMGATAALYRRCWITELKPEVFFSPEVKEMMTRVRCVANPELDKEFPAKYTCITTIETNDGRTFNMRVDYPKGEPENPISWDELAEIMRSVYRDGGGPKVMSKERHEEILHRVKNMEQEPDIGKLVEIFGSDTGYSG